ncbi:MAG: PEGA domain-containing protein [Treponema sp.]|jgi:hypothetical protein|nr:PEGA domain-containing protein [Treponema sp.]
MFWKNKKLEILPEDEVRLQPLLGVQPEVYLACLYGVAIVAVLFFVLFYPGISKPGTVLLAESEPEGAAVFVDDVYQSATPAEIFVPKGEHVVKISLPGFSPQEQTIDVKGRLFGSLLFPEKQSVRAALASAEPEKVFALGASDFAAWSFVGEPTGAYQIPQPLSEAAYRATPSDAGALNNILEAAARFAGTRASLRDLIRAKYLVDNGGIATSPLSLLASTQNIIAYLNKNPAAVSAFSSLIPASELGAVADSAWGRRKANPTDKNPSEKGTEVLIAGLLFTEIIEGNDSFFLSETIPLWSWELFLRTAPEWTAGSPTEASQEGVSWFAAKAYCEWIAEQIGKDDGEEKPPLLETARLPFKGELETAARAGFAFDGQKYEWCEDFFAPLDFLSADAKSIADVGSPERTVFSRDGEKASLPPALHSPFVSFRLVVR